MVEDSAASVVLATEQHAETMEPIARSAGAAFQVRQADSNVAGANRSINKARIDFGDRAARRCRP